MSSTKASSVRSEQLLQNGNLSRLILWRVTAGQLLKLNLIIRIKPNRKTFWSPGRF